MTALDEKTLQKRAVARAAVDWLADYVRQRPDAEPMLLGVGSGSTVSEFILALGEQPQLVAALAVASEASAAAAAGQGFRLVNPAEIAALEVYVDGADWIDPGLRTLKGGGAALAREKVLATAADCFVCLCDESKRTESLQGHVLPVEVLPAALASVMQHLNRMGAEAAQRPDTVTDNGNAILDVGGLAMSEPLEALEERISSIAGVLDCGLFARRRADLLLVAKPGKGKSGECEVEQIR